jgi:hypothetical protein
MKKVIIIFAVLAAAATIASAQDRERKQDRTHQPVPQAVLDSFAVKYPGATAEWEKERKHWEAEMKKDGKEIKAIFDVKGNFLYTETPIAVSELPKGVVEQVAARYPNKKISGAGRITDVNGVVMYEVELKGVPHMFFDAQGGYMNRED